VTEWSGKEMSVLWGQIFPVFPTTLWTFQQAKEIPSQKVCCASRTLGVFTLYHSSGTILMPQSSIWRMI
jgi:hypothetical protein